MIFLALFAVGNRKGSKLDQELLLSLNSLIGSDYRYLFDITRNSLFRGAPIFFALVALWFSGDCMERRSRMLAGLLAVCVATILSVWSQFHFHVHVRPLLEPALHLKLANPKWAEGWGRTGSFPSDTATLFFGLATVILMENWSLGMLGFLWVLVMIATPRVIFGWHYPSDIIGALVLGPGCVFLFSGTPYPRMLFARMLTLFENRMYFVHAALFLFLADAFNSFNSLRELGKTLAGMFQA
jgi:undecaprenyl-diphosphatase